MTRTRLRYSLVTLSLYFVSTVALAYSFFGTDSSSATGAQAGAGNQAAPSVMTPDQFAARVKSMSQQTQNNLSQQATTQMNKPLPNQGGPAAMAQTPPSTPAAQPMATTQPPPAPTSTASPYQPYTGFGGGQQNAPERTRSRPTNQPASGGSSGNWNVQY